MNVIYAVTMYKAAVLKSQNIRDVITSSCGIWKTLDRIQFPSMSNARIWFEGRRPEAYVTKTDDGFEVTFFVLTEEQIKPDGQATRVEVLDMALPKT